LLLSILLCSPDRGAACTTAAGLIRVITGEDMTIKAIMNTILGPAVFLSFDINVSFTKPTAIVCHVTIYFRLIVNFVGFLTPIYVSFVT
jgi:hypothetical protein